MNLSPAAFRFETDRLLIRPLARSDEELYCYIYTDAGMMRFVGPPLSPERARRSFAKALTLMDRQPVVQLFLTVLDRATQRPLGICSIPKIDAGRRAVEVGIMLRPDARAHGLAEKTLLGLIDRAFAALPIDEVWAEIAAEHIAASRLLLRIGFSRTQRVEPEAGRPGGCMWSVSRQAWRRSPNRQATSKEERPA